MCVQKRRIASRFASEANVSIADVAVQVLASSVRIVVTIAAPVERAQSVLTTVQARVSNETAASNFLSGAGGLDVVVEAIAEALAVTATISAGPSGSALNGTALSPEGIPLASADPSGAPPNIAPPPPELVIDSGTSSSALNAGGGSGTGSSTTMYPIVCVVVALVMGLGCVCWLRRRSSTKNVGGSNVGGQGSRTRFTLGQSRSRARTATGGMQGIAVVASPLHNLAVQQHSGVPNVRATTAAPGSKRHTEFADQLHSPGRGAVNSFDDAVKQDTAAFGLGGRPLSPRGKDLDDFTMKI